MDIHIDALESDREDSSDGSWVIHCTDYHSQCRICFHLMNNILQYLLQYYILK